MDALFFGTGLHGLGLPNLRPNPPPFTTTASTTAMVGNSLFNSILPLDKCLRNSKFSFNYPFRSLFFGGDPTKRRPNAKGVVLDDNGVVLVDDVAEGSVVDVEKCGGQNGNWVLKILQVKSLWSSSNDGNNVVVDEGKNSNLTPPDNDGGGGGGGQGECGDGCSVSDEDENEEQNGKIEFNREMFTKMLKKVPLVEAKLYAQFSYLGALAYSIPNIKPGNLLKRYGLKYVTSSIEKREQLALAEQKAQLANTESHQSSPEEESKEEKSQLEETECVERKSGESRLSASAAVEIVASAASYLHTQTKAILPLGSSKDEDVDHDTGYVNRGFRDHHLNINSEMASLVATTDSVTAVVAAKEEVKQAVADDLNSVSSSPCEWYICDDDKTATRYFVIQGSETIASWQANLLFEPIRFEELDVFVHRGIYEAAKGMYQQMLPEIHAYMKTHGSRAKFRFTGHSLGGSLSLLINLMLLMRGEVPYSSLLPVITFGSPCVMCGGDNLLHKLGLPKNHIQSMVMHRDIVPRAFSCIYPKAAAQLLKAVNGSFRNHPCLNNQKLLYSPMGEMLILQPDAKNSPQHDLLPSGSGLYVLTTEGYDEMEAERVLGSAKRAFLNIPHPLEILSDRSAYGSGGTIQRDHDMESYLKCLRSVIRQDLSRIRKAERERRRKIWWPLVTPRVIVGTTTHVGSSRFSFAGMVRNGRESVKRFSRLVASQHMHLLIVLLFPAKMLLIGAYSLIGPH